MRAFGLLKKVRRLELGPLLKEGALTLPVHLEAAMNRQRTVMDFQVESGVPLDPGTRHDKTMYLVKETIAQLIQRSASNGSSLLEVGGDTGWQTLAYRAQLASPSRAVIYDWQDRRLPHEKDEGVEFCEVNIETDRFPDPRWFV